MCGTGVGHFGDGRRDYRFRAAEIGNLTYVGLKNGELANGLAVAYRTERGGLDQPA
jgi:hypothetical protein